MSDEERPQRVASHNDDPDATLADRLLLALGMWPNYVEQLGTEPVIDAAVIIRTNAHRLDFVTEDWGMERGLREEAVTLVRALVDTDDCVYDHDRLCQTHSLDEDPCPHERARLFLGELDGDYEGEEDDS